MKRSMKTKAKRGSARDLFAELSEGMEALAGARHGKRTLRTHVMEFKPAPSVTPQDLDSGTKKLEDFARSVRGLLTEPTSALWRIGNRVALSQMHRRRS